MTQTNGFCLLPFPSLCVDPAASLVGPLECHHSLLAEKRASFHSLDPCSFKQTRQNRKRALSPQEETEQGAFKETLYFSASPCCLLGTKPNSHQHCLQPDGT